LDSLGVGGSGATNTNAANVPDGAFPLSPAQLGMWFAQHVDPSVPANIAQYVEGTDAFGLDTDTKRLVRLFFQPVLVALALWTGETLRRRS